MSRHFPHYLILFGILGIAVLGFALFSWDKNFQNATVIATAAAYIAWGIVHHWLHRDLYPEVVIEYIAIAVLGVVIALTLLL